MNGCGCHQQSHSLSFSLVPRRRRCCCRRRRGRSSSSRSSGRSHRSISLIVFVFGCNLLLISSNFFLLLRLLLLLLCITKFVSLCASKLDRQTYIQTHCMYVSARASITQQTHAISAHVIIDCTSLIISFRNFSRQSVSQSVSERVSEREEKKFSRQQQRSAFARWSLLLLLCITRLFFLLAHLPDTHLHLYLCVSIFVIACVRPTQR